MIYDNFISYILNITCVTAGVSPLWRILKTIQVKCYVGYIARAHKVSMLQEFRTQIFLYLMYRHPASTETTEEKDRKSWIYKYKSSTQQIGDKPPRLTHFLVDDARPAGKCSVIGHYHFHPPASSPKNRDIKQGIRCHHTKLQEHLNSIVHTV